MKRINCFLSLFFILMLTACNVVSIKGNLDAIEPSDNLVTEIRTISGIDSIEFGTFGLVILSQGEAESLSIEGSDNIVPLVKAEVQNGVLIISMEEEVNIAGLNKENILTFNIMVKDLNTITVDGAAKVEMNNLETPDLTINMNGAGQVVLEHLKADSLNVTVNGLGNIEIAGEVTTAMIDIPGAGPVNCSDLKIKNATVTISGFGGATLWVTDNLTGEITGGGSISYYGNPQTNTNSTGLGQFNSLGEK